MKIERIFFLTMILYLFFSFISISAAQIFLALSLILFLYLHIKDKKLPEVPGFFWPLLVYCALSLLASAFSRSPETSFHDSRELLLYLVVPMAYFAFKKESDIRLALKVFLASALISIAYSAVYFFFKASPGERIAGFMGHYMTQAGLLLLFCTMAMSFFLFLKTKEKLIWAGAFILAFLAILLTLTRNAWIGIVVAAVVLLAIYRPKALIALPVIVFLLYLASPPAVKQRTLSIFSTKDVSNLTRLEYLETGWKIIKEYPLLGTGPNTVDEVFKNPKYGLSEEARQNVHLHNNVIQIAAERGIPAICAWLCFVGWMGFSLLKLLRRRKDPLALSLTAGALACLLAFFSAGMFEYNFGDSEIVTLFLFLTTLPFLPFLAKEKEPSIPTAIK